jgi:rRNA pseudouridine-1189 N-methylase Emg1 (Nep1/Mra1 family)
MSKREEIAFLKVLASMLAQRKLLSSYFRKELVRIYAGKTKVRLPRQGIRFW